MGDIKAFNSEEYGFNDLQVVTLGRPIIALRGIRFKATQQKANVHGAGSKPISRTRGPVDFEGSVTVLMSEVIAMLHSQGNPAKGLLGIKPFDIIVAFAPSVSGTITTHRLVYCEFTESEINLKSGDMQVEVELPIIIGDIEWNI
jgi:hypothetical protein